MPTNKFHCALSEKRTGKSFKELHKWVDMDLEGKGVDHRNSKRHSYNEETKDYISKKFGGKIAVGEWLFHIALDYLDTLTSHEWNFKGKDINHYRFGFEPWGFIHYIDGNLTDEEMEEEFPEDFEEDNFS